MAVRNIIMGSDDILLKKSREVTVFDKRLHQLLDDMIETMHSANGAGLAAVQVGVLKRAIVVDTGEGGLVELVNPKVVSMRGDQYGEEGCLSFPGESALVHRPMKVTVTGQDRYGTEVLVKGSGLKARALCHEIDHLNGIIYKSRIGTKKN